MLFYTFCVDIKRHTRVQLVSTLLNLLLSIKNNIKNYKLICYTNFDIKKYVTEYNVEVREYYCNNTKTSIYENNNKWARESNFLNLSFNKINIYKDLYDEFKMNFIWIDLDTFICADISYLDDLPNIFLENGGNFTNGSGLFSNNKVIRIPRKNYIQGNFWKLDIDLYHELMTTFEELKQKGLKLRYDCQDLFGYHIYIKNKGSLKNINILGNNVKPNTINGLAIWSKTDPWEHASYTGLQNIYWVNNEMKTHFHPSKTIHILSFTFSSIEELNKSDLFFCKLIKPNLSNPLSLKSKFKASIYGTWIGDRIFDNVVSIALPPSLHCFCIFDGVYTKMVAIDSDKNWIIGKYVLGIIDIYSKESVSKYFHKSSNIILKREYYNIKNIEEL